MAENALLICNFRLRNIEEFEELVEKFKEKKYDIFYIGEIERENFDITILEKKITEIKNLNKKYENITIVSNIKDILFIWYRIYNNLADNFIFFIDKVNYNIIKRCENAEALVAIAELKGIEQEDINRKIYLNINYINYEQIFEFLLKKFKFRYFDNIDNMNCLKKEKDVKMNQRKNYFFNEKQVLSYGNGDKVKKIDLELEINNDTNKFFEYMENSKYFYPFYTLFIIKNYGSDEARDRLIKYFEEYNKKSNEEKEKMAELLIKTKGFKGLSFQEKIGIISSSFEMEVRKHEFTTTPLLNEIINDNGENVMYYYYIMINIILGGYFTDREHYYGNVKKALEISTEYYASEILLQSEYNDKSKKILIITDSLKGGNYSGTKLVFDIAMNIKKQYTDYQIIIYCEDNFFGRQDENLMVFDFNRRLVISSTDYKKEHLEYLGRSGVNIVYSHVNKTKEERIKELIEYAKKISPEVILTTTIYSNSINILYKLFPIISISLAEINLVNKFDLYLLPHIEHLKNIQLMFGREFDSKKMLSFDYGGNFFKSENGVLREKINVDNKAFLMITVGVRIGVDLAPEYIDIILEFLKNNNDTIWMIVGETNIQYIDKKYSEFLGTKIIKIKYIENLGEIYRTCDLYLNPQRLGGGFSMSEAIVNDLCVLTLESSPAGALHCGKENGVKDLNDYKKELKRLYEDKKYRIEKLKKEQMVQEGLSYKNIIPKLMEHIETAKKIYFERKGIK